MSTSLEFYLADAKVTFEDLIQEYGPSDPRFLKVGHLMALMELEVSTGKAFVASPSMDTGKSNFERDDKLAIQTIIQIQRETENKSHLCAEWVPLLRARKVPLNSHDKAASNYLAYLVTKSHKDLFEKDEARSTRKVSAWRVKASAL